MPTDFDDDELDLDAFEIEPTDPTPTPEPMPAISHDSEADTLVDGPPLSTSVIVIFDSPTTPLHTLAPIAASIAGHPDLLLHPGVNRVEFPVWREYANHPGIAAEIKAGHVTVLDSIPRDRGVVDYLISATYSDAGLDAILDSERNYYGSSPRGVVVTAVAAQRIRVDARCKPTT